MSNSMIYFYTLQSKVFKLDLNFPPSGPNQSALRIFGFDIPIFKGFFFRKCEIYYCTIWGNQKCQLSGKRVII